MHTATISAGQPLSLLICSGCTLLQYQWDSHSPSQCAQYAHYYNNSGTATLPLNMHRMHTATVSVGQPFSPSQCAQDAHYYNISGTATLPLNMLRMHTATVSAGQPLSLTMCTGCTLIQCQWDSHSHSQCPHNAHCYSVSGTATLPRNVHRTHTATVSTEQPLSLAMYSVTGMHRMLLQCQRNSHSPSQCAQDARCYSVSGTATLPRNVHRMHAATVSAEQPLSLAMCTGCTLLQCQRNSHSPSQCAQDARCYSVSGTATLPRNVHRMHAATVSAEQPLSLAMCTGCTLLQCQRNSHSPSQCAQDARCYSVSGTATLPRNVHRMHAATVSAEQPLSLAMCTGCTLLQCQRNSHSPSQCAQDDARCYSVSGTATLPRNVHRMHAATVSAEQPLSLAMCTGCTLLQCQRNSHSPSQCNVHRMHAAATVSAEQPLSLAMCTGCTLLQCQRNSHSPSQCAQDAHCYSVSVTATLPRNVHKMHAATVSAEQPLSLAMCTGCTLLQCQRDSHSPSQCHKTLVVDKTLYTQGATGCLATVDSNLTCQSN